MRVALKEALLEDRARRGSPIARAHFAEIVSAAPSRSSSATLIPSGTEDEQLPLPNGWWTRGTRTVGSSARAARMRSVLSASRAKSSSSQTSAAICR